MNAVTKDQVCALSLKEWKEERKNGRTEKARKEKKINKERKRTADKKN
jgi:hypothetical protein